MAILDDIIGIGWRFPIVPDAVGRLGYGSGGENVEQSLKILLLTNLRERVMRAGFGTDAREQIFAPGSETALRLLERSIGNAIRDHEPRVTVLNLRAEADPRDPTHVLVEIDYEIRATYVRGNLVFPLYLSGGGGGA
ncbi:GPW/gp25 family protein [Sphingomonas sp. S1-29]|uniref:GPW/gp25 family protein n=1 Tax=Sphingomonas sp. S1-29 TaxID=2991074 RepID=UPI00223F120B|nr:GPW/gp25 family protein [Sphingomonas sp. S1-29]UZK70309.1 GPW/gp25 family protein [Sphingomonas sp. S1-29]